MATDLETLQQFTQDVYLTRFNRFIDDITAEDGVEEVNKTIRWTNMFLDELERETDESGRPINWAFARENDVELGTVEADTTGIDLDDDVLRLVVDESRPLAIAFDGSPVSYWDVVSPNQITKRSRTGLTDKATVVGRRLLFSRAIKDTEVGGTVIADVINSIPRLENANNVVDITALETVLPYQLLVLGVAKNATLPDIVQGGLSPSFVQKYADLLEAVKRENQNSSAADEGVRDDFSYIGGIY